MAASSRTIGAYLLVMSAGLLVGPGLASVARAQDASAAPSSSPTTMTARDLAKEALNPFATSIKVPIESVTGFRVGPHRNTGESVNVEPLIPFEVTPAWNVIVQPFVAMTSLPSPDATTGLDDIQMSVFLTPTRTGTWAWGLGPIVELPTASDDQLGTGKWSGGPTGAVFYSNGPWLNGVLASHLASFAGNRHRVDVAVTSIEPQVSYTWDSGWSLQSSPTITYDWIADAWTLPLGVDVGTTFSVGTQPMSLMVGAYDLAKRQTGDPDSFVRVQLTFLFPSGEH